MVLEYFECENLRKILGVVGAVDTLRESEARAEIAECDFLGVTSPSFLSLLNSWLLVLLMLLTKLLTRSRFRDGDALGSISGLERFELGLNPDKSGDGKGDDEGEGEENGEDVFFMMLPIELALSRLRRREGANSSSGLKEMMGLEGLPASWGRSAEGGCGEANGDLRDFTRLFTLSRFREGEPECSEGKSWLSWLSGSGEMENGEKTGERKGEGSGMDIA